MIKYNFEKFNKRFLASMNNPAISNFVEKFREESKIHPENSTDEQIYYNTLNNQTKAIADKVSVLYSNRI